MYLLTRNMFEVSNLRHTEAGEVVLGSEQVGDFLPPAFGHRVQGALAAGGWLDRDPLKWWC